MIVIVDLDKTLVPFDTTIHALKIVMCKKPIVDVLKNFLKGKKHFKNYLQINVDWDTIEYPINLKVLNYIDAMKEDGNAIYLLSGSNQQIVDAVSRRLNNFDKSIGSNPDHPKLKFRNKLNYINQVIGGGNWVYIADAFRDIVIWKAAKTPILVSNSRLKYFFISKFVVRNLQLLKSDSIQISLPSSES